MLFGEIMPSTGDQLLHSSFGKKKRTFNLAGGILKCIEDSIEIREDSSRSGQKAIEGSIERDEGVWIHLNQGVGSDPTQNLPQMEGSSEHRRPPAPWRFFEWVEDSSAWVCDESCHGLEDEEDLNWKPVLQMLWSSGTTIISCEF